ncbi:MAG TPA: DUF952 domain-containing protein [Polyangiaceae bacterium]|nr:DUF952 domain-containing protein [Polyangiaceae bacterium]
MTGVIAEGGPQHIFHITERSAFATALETGAYETDSLKTERFVHCSTRAQLARTAARFFAGRSGLVILCIEAAHLGVQLRYEAADGETFPHCYSVIPLDAIVAVIDFPCRPDGGFELPEELGVFGE